MRANRWTGLGALAIAALATGAGGALAAGFFTNGVPPAGGSQYPTTLPLTGNETIPADTNLSSGLNPASESISVGQLSSNLAPGAGPRNYLLNGDMQVNQVGTGTITGGTTTVAQTAMGADRWFVDTNVGSGAGRSTVATGTPTLPAGFSKQTKVFRTSGALLQPVCLIQAIESSRATQLAGKNVMLSAWMADLGGLSSVAAAVNAYIVTGTGTDQGLGTLTASPAITPAWTGVAGGTTPAATWTMTSTMTRNSLASAFAVPSGTTEVAVEICFTPAATGAGSTDGFAITGVQLEPVLASGTVNGPSPFEFQPVDYQTRAAQRFFWRLDEPASGAALPGSCMAVGATSNICNVVLPVAMRGTTPTITISTAGTFKVNIAGTPTTIASPVASTCSTTACAVTAGNTNTAGQAELFSGGGGSGIWIVANDVVM